MVSWSPSGGNYSWFCLDRYRGEKIVRGENMMMMMMMMMIIIIITQKLFLTCRFKKHKSLLQSQHKNTNTTQRQCKYTETKTLKKEINQYPISRGGGGKQNKWNIGIKLLSLENQSSVDIKISQISAEFVLRKDWLCSGCLSMSVHTFSSWNTAAFGRTDFASEIKQRQLSENRRKNWDSSNIQTRRAPF